MSALARILTVCLLSLLLPMQGLAALGVWSGGHAPGAAACPHAGTEAAPPVAHAEALRSASTHGHGVHPRPPDGSPTPPEATDAAPVHASHATPCCMTLAPPAAVADMPAPESARPRPVSEPQAASGVTVPVPEPPPRIDPA